MSATVTGSDNAAPGTSARAARTRFRPGRVTLLVVPALVVVLVVFAWPLAQLLWRSFTDPEPGLANYQELVTGGVALPILGRTLLMTVVVTSVCLALAYPYAHLMTLVSPRWRAILVAVVLVPFWTSLMARTFAWIVLLQDTGPINALLGALGLGPLPLIGTAAGVTIAMAQVMLPFMVLPLYSTMKGIDRRLVAAARSLGATPTVAFLRVYLPLSLPGVAAGTSLVSVLTLGFYVTPSLVGSPQQSMIAQYIAVRVQQMLEFGTGGALSLILLVVAFALLALVSRVAQPAALVGATERREDQ